MPIDPELAEWVEQQQAVEARRVKRARLHGYFVVYGLVALFAVYSAWGTN